MLNSNKHREKSRQFDINYTAAKISNLSHVKEFNDGISMLVEYRSENNSMKYF